MSILDDIRVTLEKKITYHFYKQKNNAHCKTVYGLEQPMWLWTHRSNDCEAAETLKVSHLLKWFINICSLSNSHSIAVVCPSSSFQQTLLSLVGDTSSVFRGQLTFLSYSELLSDISLQEDQFSVVIYSFGNNITDANCRFVKSDGIKCISRAIYAARDIFILTCEASWAYAPTLRWKCPAWHQVVTDIEKLESPTARSPELPISDQASIPKIPSIIGPRIPICCPKHDREKSLATGNNAFDGFCAQKCFSPYQCGNQTHVCLKECHLANSHKDCPFPCSKQLPCGHPCMMPCCEPCDCLEEKWISKECSHTMVTSFDPESQLGIQETFSHAFHGRCVDSHLPCYVEVPTVCAQCLGDFKVQCSAIQGTGHALDSPVLECPDCKQRRRFIRTEVRHELVSEMSVKREETRAAVRANMKKYRKMTGGGIFQEGQRVYLNNVDALRDPFFGDFSPDIEFEDIEGPSLSGIHGIVAASLVDPVDSVSEVKYLVKLVTGSYILAADFGLQAVGAICSTAGLDGPLLLTCQTENGNSLNRSAYEKLFKVLKGSTAHLHQIVKDIPVPADIFEKGLNETTVSVGDIVVTIQEEDFEMNEIHSAPFAKVIATFYYYEENIPDEPDSKRHRSESRDTVPSILNRCRVLSSFDLTFSAPVNALQPITTIGKDVLVNDSSKQLMSPECDTFEPFILSAVKSKINPLVLGDSPVNIQHNHITEAEIFCLLDVVNSPFNKFPTSDSNVVNGRLVSSVPTAMVVSKQFFFRNHRLFSSFARRRHMGATSEAPQKMIQTPCSVALIPFIFISPDEEAQAEETLEREILSKLDEVAESRFRESCDKLAFQNDSDRFKREQKLSTPTESLRESSVVYSTPRPVRLPHEVNSLRARFAALDPPPEKDFVVMAIKKYQLSLKFRNSKNQILALSKSYADMREKMIADIDSNRRYAESK
eukprot:Tbor_TRINITY_DN4786_c0_g1::TRINITY_DN4786_c0_g1_i1::g.17100::m.17100